MLSTCALSSGAQMKWNQTYQTYINQYKDLAIEQMLRYRIPASITLAQGLFESAGGRSDLVGQGDNTSASNATTGPVLHSIMTTMPGANASEYTVTQETAMKTIASFLQDSHATPDCSSSRRPTTRVGRED